MSFNTEPDENIGHSAGNIANGNLEVCIAVLSKIAATGCVTIMILFTPATFPTVLRCSAFNACLFFQQIAICTAPFLLEYSFGPYDCSAFVIFASTGLIASLALSVFTKETMKAPLMDTVEQFHNFVQCI